MSAPSSGRSTASTAFESVGAGPALALLPGTFADRRAWLKQVGALSGRYRVLLLDPRGTGATPDPGTSFTPADLAADVLAVLDEAEIERVTLAGHSLGAAVAVELAAAHPERVEALVLVAPALELDPHIGAVLDTWQALAAGSLSDHDLHVALVVNAFAPAAFERLVPAVVTAMDRAPMHRDTIARYVECDRALDAARLGAGIRARALVVAGELDAVAGVEQARRAAAAIPGARLEVLPGVGHNPHLEAAPAFNRLLASFLAG